MHRAVLVVVTLLATGAICLAQGIGHTCDPTGTWFGGSDPNVPTYQLTVVPEAAARYSVVYQLMPDPGSRLGSYTGEMIKDGAQTYTQYAITTFTENQAGVEFYASLGIIVDVGAWEADAVYGDVVMLDCDTIKSTITWFGWYIPITLEKVPFVTQPEIEYIRDFLGGEPIVETYHRVSGANCPVCTMGGSVTGSVTALKSGAKDKLPPKGHKR